MKWKFWICHVLLFAVGRANCCRNRHNLVSRFWRNLEQKLGCEIQFFVETHGDLAAFARSHNGICLVDPFERKPMRD